ncbi:hypothetical protein LTR84_007311 [Exophiala bonariae]|uniref:Uncharacterized protein n=1 Tax=Exophiala bonariae TaxID=1690606 RepID=A0AAV9MZ78_9EURO|nr:hypothetical protein LTR84_007311 [Exophiala bonariae]
MPGIYRNLATDRAFKELQGGLFLNDKDTHSRIEVFVTEPKTKLEFEWQHVSARADNTNDRLGGFDPGQHYSQMEQDTSIPPFHTAKVALSTISALQEHTRTSLPLCALFIRKRNSFSELSISSTFFNQLCNEISIPREFQDYILYFGRRGYEVEISPPPFDLDGLVTQSGSSNPTWMAMGVVRFMEDNGRVNIENPSKQWSIRQTALFSRYDQQQVKAFWLFISISNSVESLLDEIWTSPEHDTSSPWQTLYTLYHYAACNWRPYVVALMHELERHEMELLGTAPDNTGPVPLPGAEERQALLILERQVSTAKLGIQSTKADVEFLQTQLQSYDFGGRKDASAWGRHFTGIVRNLNVNLMRVEEMYLRLESLTTLVSSFLDLNGSHALRVLSEESRYENETMRKLNQRMAELAEKNAEEAVTVTVLATLTMIYLPFTVVSNFFSTSFVGTVTSSNRIFVTQDCWILFVISVGLTFLTFYVWKTWTRLKVRHQYPFWWPLLGIMRPKRFSEKDHLEPREDYDFRNVILSEDTN